MGKKNKQLTRQPTHIHTGIVLQDVKGLVSDCKAIFREVLQSNSLGFIEHRAARNKLICNLTGAGATRAEAKYVYQVVPFLETPYGFYWLANSLEFKFQEGMHHLESVSILVFQGEANDERKIALLRAEWACSEADVRAPHAQPHWHIYPSRINQGFDQFRNEFQADSEVQSFEPDEDVQANDDAEAEWDRAERFHFAMAARWHVEGKDAHTQEIQSDMLLNWLAGCLRYIQSQFEFLYLRA
jgi:hypothetical protein